MDDKRRVLLAMSGGVDSSVAAALLLEAGCQVTGVFLCLGGAVRADNDSPGCCSPTDAADARSVAQKLGIDLFVLDASREFAPIIEQFAREYAAGRTPNPCILCNAQVKFGYLMRQADRLGMDFVATGHHARMALGQVHRAAAKDQSYALFAVPREHLPRMLLPIGELGGKARVRQIAAELGLKVADKPDSQEICFVSEHHRSVLQRLAPQALQPGDIVDAQGKVLGRHQGVGNFTIGQRRGVRVAVGIPYYVTAIDPASATVTIGPVEQLQRRSLQASRANWHIDPPPAAFRATIQIRYNHPGAPGTVTPAGPEGFAVEFDQPVLAVTPGQAAVVYDGDRLLGGGWIE
jgi:tRNA-specific 2-thiouridylase